MVTGCSSAAPCSKPLASTNNFTASASSTPPYSSSMAGPWLWPPEGFWESFNPLSVVCIGSGRGFPSGQRGQA
jgi:hypothetical protein